jgi:hypothetical protein
MHLFEGIGGIAGNVGNLMSHAGKLSSMITKDFDVLKSMGTLTHGARRCRLEQEHLGCGNSVRVAEPKMKR